jgi:lipid-A-disaccharide synthase
MKYYIIAGEASGDLHASNLMEAIKKNDPGARFRCWGGDRMQSAGAVLVKHIRELAFMGFAEVLVNLGKILSNFRLCKRDLLAWKPDVVILVDYPGFNLRMAAFAKKQGIPVTYYVSPQIWAWKQSRLRTIRRNVDLMLVILPFEKDFYARSGMEVNYVGHPLLDAVEEFKDQSDPLEFRKRNGLPDKPLVAILPGSREQEISRMLPGMLAVCGEFPSHHFALAGLSMLPAAAYSKEPLPQNATLVMDQTQALLSNAEAALVASGTATLEAALMGVPMVVCYKAGWVTYQIARRLAKVNYISLVNLVLNQALVKELIQDDFNEKSVSRELKRLIDEPGYRDRILSGYSELKTLLGGQGASERAAGAIAALLRGVSPR